MDLIKGLIGFFVGVALVVFAFAGFVLVWALLWAIPTWLLWNWLMPDLFGMVEITIWQAIGINLLSGILFKSKVGEKKEKKEGKKKTKEFILG